MIIKKKSKSRKSKLNEIQTKISSYFNKKPKQKSKNKKRQNSLKENLNNHNKFSIARKSSQNLQVIQQKNNNFKTSMLNFKLSKDKGKKNSISINKKNRFPQFSNNLFQIARKKHNRVQSIYNSNSNLSQFRKENKNQVYCSTRDAKNLLKKQKSKKTSSRSKSRLRALISTKKFELKNPQYCPENQHEIFKFLSKKQHSQINSDFYLFKKQPDITIQSRNYLFEWITELAENFQLLDKTLFITLDVLDIYMNVFRVSKYSLQLLGISILFIFSKHEEIYPPTVSDFLNACNQKYKEKDIYEIEAEIFDLLKYDLNRVTVLDFYYILSKSIGFTSQENTFGINILKMCYKNPEIQSNSKSLIAFSVCSFLCSITKKTFFRKKRIGQRIHFCYEIFFPDQKNLIVLKQPQSDVKYLSLQIQNMIEQFFQQDQTQRLFQKCLKEIDTNKSKGNFFLNDLNVQKNQINQFHEQ